jgi:hypothetical protein
MFLWRGSNKIKSSNKKTPLHPKTGEFMGSITFCVGKWLM